MGRKAAPQPLTGLTGISETENRVSPAPKSSPSPRSPFTSRFSSNKSQSNSPANTQPVHIATLQQQPQARFPAIASAIHSPTPPVESPTRDSSSLPQSQPARLHSSHSNHRQPTEDDKESVKSGFIFNFSKSSKSSDRPPPNHNSAGTGETMSRGTINPVTKQSSKQSDTSAYVEPVQRPAPSLPSKSDVSLASSADQSISSNSTKKGSKPKPFTLLSRSKSHREKDGRSPGNTPSPKEFAQLKIVEPERAHTFAPAKTSHDRSHRDVMPSSRNHSTDRAPSRDASTNRGGNQERENNRLHSSSLRDGNGGSSFFSGLKSSSNRAAEMIGKGLFGKGGRSASTTEREPAVDDEHYVLKVINRPLVEQTRLTRISKRLEDSRDKTEFWMPAFPWRAIDYLNYKGCDVEGLYRVPGSGPQIKKWQRKFDEQGDVDLFGQDDLYDINIIGSMLKAWLRELPDELFPKQAQERIARECAGADSVPQMLIDELSNLSPFNYYLLFAITCHLSLLLAHSDKNKMDFRNLCICFQPCMKIDAFCFKFLVCDWRDCWKGCRNEARYIEEEYTLFDQPPPPGLAGSRKLGTEEPVDDRNVSSSDSSKQSTQTEDPKSRLKKKSAPQHENGSLASNNSTVSTTITVDSERQTTPPRRSGDMRPLSPIKPLSPLGF